MNIRILDDSPRSGWEELNAALDDIYFTRSWYLLSRHIQAGDAYCFVFEQNGERACYPFFKVPIPGTALFDIQGAYGYNGVSTSCYEGRFIRDFHRAFAEYCHNEQVVAEFTRFHPLTANHRFAAGGIQVHDLRDTVMVDLSMAYDDLWEGYTAANRNKIRKGRRLGLTIGEGLSPDDFQAAYRCYISSMEAMGADDFYHWPEAYFSELASWPSSRCLLLIAYHEGEVAGMAMFLFHRDLAHYHISARKHGDHGLPVDNLLLDEGIRRCQARGARILHLGGGRTNDPRDELLVFKLNFSSRRLRFRLGTRKHDEQAFDRLSAAWESSHPDIADRFRNYFLKYRIA